MFSAKEWPDDVVSIKVNSEIKIYRDVSFVLLRFLWDNQLFSHIGLIFTIEYNYNTRVNKEKHYTCVYWCKQLYVVVHKGM